MGFVCPVCSTPQADGEHLANHLAFTAMLHGDDHEAWLAEHVPDWADHDPGGLASAVTPLAEGTDDEVEESEAPPDSNLSPVTGGPRPTEPTDLDPETRRIVERAQEMTERKYGSDDVEE